MNLLELTCPTPAENLACDEALLLQIDEHLAAATRETPEGGPPAARPPVRARGEAANRTPTSSAAEFPPSHEGLAPATVGPPLGWLRLWESPQYAVILGRSNRVREEVKVEACRRDGVPILRRCSGGGAVVLGPGCLLFTLVLPISPEQHLQGIQAVTAALLRRIADALMNATPSVRIELCGTSDLAIDGLKFSGNSQRWRRCAMLHHGTLLYDFEIARVSRYLHRPQRQPEYRGSREHEDFLVNLPVCRDQLQQALINAWQARPHRLPIPIETAADLANSRYHTDDWNLRL